MNSLPQDNEPRKQCEGPCGQILPATTKFFHKAPGYKYDVYKLCKECRQAKRRKPPVVSDVPEGYRRCTGSCERVLLATPENFYANRTSCKVCIKSQMKSYRDAHLEESRERSKKYRESHKDEMKEWKKQHYQANKEEISKKHKAYVEANRDKVRKQRKKSAEINRERIRDYHKVYYNSSRLHWIEYHKQRYKDHGETIREQTRRYRKSQRGRAAHRAAEHKRRAQKLAVGGSYTAQELQEQLVRQKHKCYYCKAKLGKGKGAWHADHIVPLSRGGTNDISNIVIACPTCNMRKNDKLPHEWIDGGRLL